MSTTTTTIDQITDELIDSINKIYRRERIPHLQYLQLHKKIFNLCSTTEQSETIQFNGEPLYNLVSDILDQCRNLVQRAGDDLENEELLKYYVTEWERYYSLSQKTDKLFDHLNKYWITREREQQKQCYYIYQLALVKWRNVFEPLNTRIMNEVLKLIERERNGEIIDANLIRSVVKSYVEIGSIRDEEYVVIDTLEFYKRTFQDIFIEETNKFCVVQSNSFICKLTVLEYITKVYSIIIIEEKRVRDYLNKVTLEPVIYTCERAFISDHIDVFIEEIERLLCVENMQGLKEVFKFVCRVQFDQTKLSDVLEQHIRRQGLTAIEKCGENATNDAVLYVTTITKVTKKYETLVLNVFNNYKYLVDAFNKALSKFINHNYVTERENSTSIKSAELVAKYCDIILQKNSKNPENADLEDILDKTVVVFEHLEDKDVFQKLYTKYLATRLVLNTSISNDVELSMINKLKAVCGYEFTYRFHRMITDMNDSRRNNDQFKECYGLLDNDIDYNINVLVSGTWPFNQQQETYTCSLPSEVEPVMHTFTDFFLYQVGGRKMSWINQLSRGELITNCFENKYTLQVSGFQMVILLQYNLCDSFTVKELEEKTQMKSEHLVKVLQMLINAKLLTSDDGEYDLKATSVIRLSLNYKYKTLRVILNKPMKSDQKTEEKTTANVISDGRNYVIQAAIVRILKTQKTLSHQQLIAEVIIQLSSKFNPTTQSIKKSIEILIDKDYIERIDDTKYSYVV